MPELIHESHISTFFVHLFFRMVILVQDSPLLNSEKGRWKGINSCLLRYYFFKFLTNHTKYLAKHRSFLKLVFTIQGCRFLFRKLFLLKQLAETNSKEDIEKFGTVLLISSILYHMRDLKGVIQLVVVPSN